MGGKSKQSKKDKFISSEHSDDKLTNENESQEDSGDDFDNKESISKVSHKRIPSDEDSDHENQPKRKKKKKDPKATGQVNSKNKKSIRQVKREKFLQRKAEWEAAAKDQLKSECLNYLSQWKHDRQNWKFMKAKQVWLYKNKFSEVYVPNDSWPLLLEYFESAKGNIRNMLLSDANKIMKQMDDWSAAQNTQDDKEESENKESDNEESVKKPSESLYKRARELIQYLQE